MVKLKSISGKNKVEDQFIDRKVAFIGENLELFEKINQKKEIEASTMNSTIVDDVSNLDMIIFDNDFLSNKEIIERLQSLKNHKIKKRIIPKGVNFYLGSDNSTTQGQITKI